MTDVREGQPDGQVRRPHRRTVRWWVGIVLTAALLAALVRVLIPVGLVLGWSSQRDERDQAELATQRRSAEEALGRLQTASEDGELTYGEIVEAGVGILAISRTDSQIRVTSAYSATFGADATCYVLIVNTPPSSRTTPAALEMARCPPWTPPTRTASPS
jgi:hypothetical protein